MSLQDPTKKMSKSDTDLNNIVALLDKPDIIRKKLKRAVTDSGKQIIFDLEKRPGVANLMNLYSGLTGLEISAVESHFDGKMYSDFKIELSDLTIDTLTPIKNEYEKIMGDRSFLNSILENGRTKAKKIAAKTLRKVYKKIGFLPIQS